MQPASFYLKNLLHDCAILCNSTGYNRYNVNYMKLNPSFFASKFSPFYLFVSIGVVFEGRGGLLPQGDKLGRWLGPNSRRSKTKCLWNGRQVRQPQGEGLEDMVLVELTEVVEQRYKWSKLGKGHSSSSKNQVSRPFFLL